MRRRKITTDSELLDFIGVSKPEHQRIVLAHLPCGIETADEAIRDRTNVMVNAPRALIICAWKGMVDAFRRLEKGEGRR